MKAATLGKRNGRKVCPKHKPGRPNQSRNRVSPPTLPCAWQRFSPFRPGFPSRTWRDVCPGLRELLPGSNITQFRTNVALGSERNPRSKRRKALPSQGSVGGVTRFRPRLDLPGLHFGQFGSPFEAKCKGDLHCSIKMSPPLTSTLQYAQVVSTYRIRCTEKGRIVDTEDV